jgi:hypothetical protein
MSDRTSLIACALLGVVCAALAFMAMFAFLPSGQPAIIKPTMIVLPSPTTSELPIVTATPYTTPGPAGDQPASPTTGS